MLLLKIQVYLSAIIFLFSVFFDDICLDDFEILKIDQSKKDCQDLGHCRISEFTCSTLEFQQHFAKSFGNTIWHNVHIWQVLYCDKGDLMYLEHWNISLQLFPKYSLLQNAYTLVKMAGGGEELLRSLCWQSVKCMMQFKAALLSRQQLVRWLIMCGV